MKIKERVPLNHEPIKGTEAVKQYDRGARLYMLPEYRYFVWKILRRGIRTGKVLDIGTGSGRLIIELARSRGNFDITGLDVSDDMLARAGENIRAAGMMEKVTLVKANAAAIPFPDCCFDLVISYASLHHWQAPEKVLAEARRVVKPSGVVIIRDNRRVYGNPFWETFIRGLSLFMNKRHRDNWPRAIMSSYTLAEIKEIVSRSRLDYNVSTDFIRFDLCVETPSRKTR